MSIESQQHSVKICEAIQAHELLYELLKNFHIFKTMRHTLSIYEQQTVAFSKLE